MANQHARTILPVPDQEQHGLTTYDAKDPDTRFPPIQTIEPPEGAPNVVFILIDDSGFGSSSAFGGPLKPPTSRGWPQAASALTVFTRLHCAPLRVRRS